MNGGVDHLLSEEVIDLTRGPSGLGFNIVGGTDQQYISNDSGIYVSRIKEDGAAALDGRLQEGDKILAVNGKELKNMLHQHVVDLFRTAGDKVSLRVQHRVCITYFLGRWTPANRLRLNPDKTEVLFLEDRRQACVEDSLVLNGVTMPLKGQVCILAVILEVQVNSVTRVAVYQLHLVHRLRSYLSADCFARVANVLR